MSFRYLTAGESHGKGLIGILEGIPSQLEVSTSYIHAHLKRRKLGYGRGARQKIETDEVEIFSGIRFGKTLGSPISLWMPNRDWSAWKEIMEVEAPQDAETPVRRKVQVPRPGHADLVGGIKYAHEDMRNVLERSSARETAIRVGLGTISRKLLEDLGITIGSRVTRIGTQKDLNPLTLPVSELNAAADASPVRCLCSGTTEKIISEIEKARKDGETLGGEFEVYAAGVPVGLGSYAQWDRRLEGDIAKNFMSLNAIKGVDVGLGFKLGAVRGSEAHDALIPGNLLGHVQFQSNRAGGIEGGMSNGQPIVVRAVMKPLATLMSPLHSVHLQTGQAQSAHIERSDICAVPAAAVIGESLLALTLTGAILEKFGGDSMPELLERVTSWKKRCVIETR